MPDEILPPAAEVGFLPQGDWPGTRLAYRFVPPADGQPARLLVTLAFDPTGVAVATASPFYGVFRSHLDHPRTLVRLHVSVLPREPLGDPETLRVALAKFVGDVAAELHAAEGDGRANTVTATLEVPIDPAGLSRCPDAAVPLDVGLSVIVAPNIATMTLVPDLGTGTAFADAFEATFAARLAGVAAGAPCAVRYDGITVAPGKAAYFALAPLARGTVRGEANVPEYDAALSPVTYRSMLFAGRDIGAWVEPPLAAVDALLAPDTALLLDPAQRTELNAARAKLAAALPRWLVPAYVTDDAATAAGLVEGDLAAGRRELELALRSGLAAAYRTTVVQVPATPRFTGAGGDTVVAGTIRPVGDVAPDVSVVGGGVPLRAAGAYLSFVVSGEGRAAVEGVPLEFAADSVDARGRWRGLTRPDAPVAAGTVTVPVPLREEPPVPEPRRQTATQDPGEGVAGSLRWTYEVEVGLPPTTPRDALWVTVAAAEAGRSDEDAAEPRALIAALGAFALAWPALKPYVAGIAAEAPAVPPARVAGAVLELLRPLVTAWSGARPEPVADPRPAGTQYVLDLGEHERGTVRVMATTQVWPLLNGAAPRAEPAEQSPGWYRADYGCEPGEPTLRLTWPGLDVRARQSAHATCRMVRNGRLSADLAVATSPELLLLSRAAGFAGRVVPTVEVAPMRVPFGESLATTLREVLAPLAAVGTEVLPRRRLHVGVDYVWALAATRTRVAVLSTDPEIGPGTDGLPTVDDVCGMVAAACEGWRRDAPPGADGALEVAVRLTDVEGVPLARLDRLEIVLPPGWAGGSS